VDDYLASVPEARREAMEGLRAACLEELHRFEESLAHGMPAYSRNGAVEIGFANRRRYISLYVLRNDVMDAHRGLVDHLDVGKGCIRYGRPADINFSVVRSLLRETSASRGPICE
jgi:uncharacterized protein YdhG (YjbR/CyaY superfamily)